MIGRLRLDRLANLIESFLKEKQAKASEAEEERSRSGSLSRSPPSPPQSGPLYYKSAEGGRHVSTPQDLQEEMRSAVPLADALATNFSRVPSFPKLRKMHSMPVSTMETPGVPNVHLSMRQESSGGGGSAAADGGVSITLTPGTPDTLASAENLAAQVEAGVAASAPTSTRERRPLVNRQAISNLDAYADTQMPPRDYMVVSNPASDSHGAGEERIIPLIPFDELMLIETLGTGRVSTIYRAAWKRGVYGPSSPAGVQMVALKVAMVNSITGDTSHIDELRREADIAARLSHPNVCDLVGVAADQECFCLAYDYCEGGNLLSLLSDSTRYYEYLPIALDIANGLAYLHSRNGKHEQNGCSTHKH